MRARIRLSLLLLPALWFASPAPIARAGAPPVWNREIDGTIFDAFGPVGGAWLGGLDRARPQFVDIDADSDPDLFVAEEDGRLRFYRNDGTAGAPSFRFITDDYSGKHEFYFTRFVDIDADGDQDLLVEAPAFEEEGPDGNVALRPGGFLYRNEGTPLEPEWVLDSPRGDGYFADENGLPIGFDTTAPDFVDLEGDGDPDLLMGVATGAIILYRNVGTPTAPAFRYETSSYQDVLIIFGACNPEFADPVTLGDWWRSQGPTPRHGFMLFSFFDVDADSRPDLFVGDSNNSNVYYFTNVGGSPDPNFQCVSESFLPDSTGGPGLFSRQLVSAFEDLDGDGDADCVVGAGVEVTTPVTLWQFRNDGSSTVPNYRFVTSRYLDEFDLGRRTAPLLADFEVDGRLDLYVGIESEQYISQYGNIGTATDPQFALFEEAWRPMPLTSAITPESADLDSDGDLDLFVGVSSGAVRWFRNEGPPASPAFVEVTTDSAFGEPSSKRIRRATRQQATPRFLDEDADGDLDLLVGRWQSGQDGNATILLFRNDGTPSVPDLVLASEDWRGLGPFGRSVAPALGDLDGDSDLDLVVGLADGTVRGYRNVGTPAHAQFVPDGAPALDVGRDATPYLADIDADGDLDLFCGETGGGVNFFRNEAAANANPTPFVLTTPVVDAEVNGRQPVEFTWEASSDPDARAPVTYELRFALSPDAPPAQWRTYPGLTEPRASIVLHEGAFRYQESFWWTVVATDGVADAPTPEWRRGRHATWDSIHGEIPGDQEPRDFSHPERSFAFAVGRAAPNPSREGVSIALTLPSPGRVVARVYDLLGRRVATITDTDLAAGPHVIEWDGRTENGTFAGAGVYTCRVRWGRELVSRRIVRTR